MNKKTVVAYGSLFAGGMLLHVLLHLVYPYGIAYGDTMSYYRLGRDFQLLSPNIFDWIRPPLFALLLKFVAQFPQPTVVLFWIYALMFSLNIPLILWAIRPLFMRLGNAWLCAALVLCSELFLERLALYSVQVMSDTFYAHLVLAGSLLIIGSYLRHLRPLWILITGFFLLGIAVFTRPVGLALFPVGILFLFFLRSEKLLPNRKGMLSLSLCILSLVGPVLLWSARNAYVYGSFSFTAFTGKQLLPAVLHLVQDDDVLLPDASENAFFIRSLRTFEAAHPHTEQDTYRWVTSPEVPAPFDVIMERSPSHDNVMFRQMLLVNAVAMQMAERVIMQHPFAYAWQVLSLYGSYFAPSYLSYTAAVRLQPDVAPLYRDIARVVEPDVMQGLYPGMSLLDVQSDPLAGFILGTLWLRPGIRHAIPYGNIVMICLLHLMAVASLFIMFSKQRFTSSARSASVIVSFLFFSVAAQYLLTALTEIPIERYTIPGEVPLRLSVILFVVFIVPELWQRVYYPSRRYSADIAF